MNEFELIARFFSRPPRAASVHLGVGDDAALVAPTPGCELAVSVDMLVGGRHFFSDVDPEKLGRKTLAVNLSDMAAMGATPKWALLAGALPDDDAAWLAAFARGFYAQADAHGVALVGGDTTRGPRNLCLTIAGEVPTGQAIRRAGALPGDDVWVSGELGGAMLALAAIDGRTKLGADELAPLQRRLERPEPRVALGIALRGTASAMLDVSDGLTGDLGHILDASGAGARVDLERIPCAPALAARRQGPERELALACLLAGGDDYELLFTARNAARERVAAIAQEVGVPLTRIGKVTPPETGLVVRAEGGVALRALPRAFDHFAAPATGQGGQA